MRALFSLFFLFALVLLSSTPIHAAFPGNMHFLLGDDAIVAAPVLAAGMTFGGSYDFEGPFTSDYLPTMEGWLYANHTFVATFITLRTTLGTSVSATHDHLIYASKGCVDPFLLHEIEDVCRGDCLIHYGIALVAKVVDKRSWNQSGVYQPIIAPPIQKKSQYTVQVYVTDDPFLAPILISGNGV